MKNEINDLKSFLLEGKTFFYLVKDVENILTSDGSINKAKAYMIVYNENHEEITSLNIHDDCLKVQYALPEHAKEWYIKHSTKSQG